MHVIRTGKLGCMPEEVCELASYIVEDCQHLELCGLMTSGTCANDDTVCSSSPDFAVSYYSPGLVASLVCVYDHNVHIYNICRHCCSVRKQ